MCCGLCLWQWRYAFQFFPGCRILCILLDVEVGIPFILVPFVFWHWPHSVCTPCIPVLVGCLLPPLPPILSSRLDRLHCCLHQYLPFGLALGWGLDVWGDVAVITPGSFSSFCVCVLGFFFRCQFYQYFLFGLLGVLVCSVCVTGYIFFTVSGMLVAFLPSIHFGGCLSFVIILCRLFSPFLPGGSTFLVTWYLVILVG